jgi:lysozyme
MIADAESLLVAEEGRKNYVYPDQFGYPTGGIGHKDTSMTIGACVSDAQIDAWFAADVAVAKNGIAAHWPAITSLDPVRQAYVVSMAFQLGVGGVLGFSHMLVCLAAGDWQGAHDGALASVWHKQTPGRCERAATAFLTGQWQQVP